MKVSPILAGAVGCLLLFMPVRGADLSAQFAAMNAPMAPFRMTDEIYYVGARDVTSFLIVSDAGLILTDGGFAQTAPQIQANIKALGFDIANVKILLNSHAHFDHAGGLAELKAASGARLLASAKDAPVLESGGKADFAHFGPQGYFPPVKVDGMIADGQQTTLGNVTLTAHLTPGHTKGCTSWTMIAHVHGKPENVLFICSLTVLPTYRLLSEPDYPQMSADFEASFKTLGGLPCDIFLASHGSFFDLVGKREKMKANPAINPFIDPTGCRTYIDWAQARYNAELAKERMKP